MFHVQGALVLILVATSVAQNDVLVNCETDMVTIKWRPALESEQEVDPSKAFLGHCAPTNLAKNELTFQVQLNECDFRRTVTANKYIYRNVLTYKPDSEMPVMSASVECVYDRDLFWDPPVFNPATQSVSEPEDLLFTMELMNNDFSGPAPSSTFPLGSSIPIRAAVHQQAHTPLLLLPEDCVAATGPVLRQASQIHPIIINSGCLVESKNGNSQFLPRVKSSEIRLSLQAFKFALGEDIYLHCKLVAWDFQNFSVDKKACHYKKGQERWELLDDPSQSYLCGCCDSFCRTLWRRRNIQSGVSWKKVMLGPLIIIEDPQQGNSSVKIEVQGVRQSPVWLVIVGVPLVLLAAMGAMATTYYMCFWRGGRIGYRRSRDLLTTKY